MLVDCLRAGAFAPALGLSPVWGREQAPKSTGELCRRSRLRPVCVSLCKVGLFQGPYYTSTPPPSGQLSEPCKPRAATVIAFRQETKKAKQLDKQEHLYYNQVRE